MTTKTARQALNEIANLGTCGHGKTPAYKLFQEAIDIAVSDTTDWLPIESAPLDRTLIDLRRGSIRWTDCHFEPRRNCFVRVHGYPSVTTILSPRPTHWMPRPSGLQDPYTGDFTGKALSDD